MSLVEQKNDKVKVVKSFLSDVAENESLTKKDFRVFLYLLTELNGSEYTKISQKKIGIELFLDKSSVSKALSNLIAERVIDKSYTESNSYKFKETRLFLSDYLT